MAARAPGASAASSGQDASQALTSERRATGTTTPTVPADLARRPRRRPRGSRPRGRRRRVDLAGRDAGRAHRGRAGRRRGRRARRTPRRTRRSPRSCGSWSTGGTRGAPCPPAPSARGRGGLRGHRPRRLRRVADDRPRGGAAAAADHPPLHRREVLRLVDEHVGERVVLDAVGRRRPAHGRRSVLALRRPVVSSWTSPPEEVVELVVLLGARRHVAEGVAQLVEQRHVLDRRGRRRRAHDFDSSRWSSGDSTPSADARQELGVAQPAQHRRRVERRPPLDARSRRTTGCESISSLNASRPRSRPRSPRTWRHIASSSDEATRGICRLRRPWRHQLAAQPAERAAGRARSRRRARRSGTRAGDPGACWRATYAASARPSAPSP